MEMSSHECKVSKVNGVQGAPIKNNPLEKNAVIQPRQHGLEPNFQTLYVHIHPTLPANFIEITDIVPQIQQL